MPTQEKVEAVEELRSRLNGVKAVVLTEYRGLTVQQLGDLRKQLRAVSAEYKIVKNRLARLAIASSELQGLGTHLKGPTGVIFSKEDPRRCTRSRGRIRRWRSRRATSRGRCCRLPSSRRSPTCRRARRSGRSWSARSRASWPGWSGCWRRRSASSSTSCSNAARRPATNRKRRVANKRRA
ncbi:MAG: 50S ribosomal protein L10 [Candidatus Rokuibacteriota bacterium]|nr:MAG: 50S ribosomal protein L10 [Candidatus Rokubacteria bacterium]